MSRESVIAALGDLGRALTLLQHSVDELRNTLLADLEPPNTRSGTPTQRVLAAVADFYDTSVADLLSPSRRREVMRPRQVAMYVLHHHLGLSYHRIGALFDRDHSTVIYGVQQVRDHEDTVKLLELFGGP